MTTVLNAIYEVGFLGFSYGFWEGRTSTKRWTHCGSAFIRNE